MLKWRVPVSWRDHTGNQPPDIHTPAHPFIDIELARDRQGAEIGWTRTKAMVDTGASYSLISRKYLGAVGAEATKTLEMSGNWSRTDTQFYYLCIRAVGAEPFTLRAEVGELHVDLDDGECLAVIGMDFLRFGTLLIEALHGDSYFELTEEKIRRAQAISVAT